MKIDAGTRVALRKAAGVNPKYTGSVNGPDGERLAKWIARTIRCGIRTARSMAKQAMMSDEDFAKGDK